MAQTFRFLCTLLLLGAFCEVKTEGVTTPPPMPTPDGSVTTPPPTPTPDGSVTTPPPTPTPDGSVTTPPPTPTPDGSVTTPPPTPTPDESVTTPPPTPTPDGSVTTPPPTPTPDGSVTTPPPTPTPDESVTTPPPKPTPDGSVTTPPPTPTPDGSVTTPPPTPTPDGSVTTPPPTPTPDGSVTTPPPTPTPDGSVTTPPPTPTPDGSVTTPPPTPTPDESVTTPPPASSTPGETTPPPDGCAFSPCALGSTCLSRAGGTFECACLPGDYYAEVCVPGRVFPGQLGLNVRFRDDLRNPASELFKNTAQLVTDNLRQAFDNTSYITSRVVEFLSAPSARLSFRNQDSTTTASVQIVFNQASNITAENVTVMIQNCGDLSSCPNLTKFNPTSLCDADPCDPTSTTCKGNEGGFTCNCQSSYINSDLSQRMCIACPSGQQAVDNKCVNCPFGFSGFNCAENWKLVVVIVATVLGAALLISVIVLITLSVRFKKRSKASSTPDIGKPYTSHFSANSPLVNSNRGSPAVTGMQRIPRATAHQGWNTASNMEMTNSRQNLISSGGDSRYKDNPYTQNRPQSNPYTSSRGQDNPYFKNDSR